jgi:hypothetical protein
MARRPRKKVTTISEELGGSGGFNILVVGLGGVVVGYFLANYLAQHSNVAASAPTQTTAGYLAGPGRRRHGGGGGGGGSSQPQGASMFTPASDGSDVSFDDTPSFDEGY